MGPREALFVYFRMGEIRAFAYTDRNDLREEKMMR